MNIIFQIIIFGFSCVGLFLGGKFMSNSAIRISKFLGWKEFVVSFFLISFIASLPEISIGITAALKGIPELSFGNIIGSNIIHFTLAIGLSVLMLGGVTTNSRTVQIGSTFAAVVGVFPLFMLWDGVVGRIDGVILMLSFIVYTVWIFSKKEHFTKVYKFKKGIKEISTGVGSFFKDIIFLAIGSIFILLSAQGIVVSASDLAGALNVPVGLIGLLIVGIGTALPESYFSAMSATKNQSWMILGNLMGCVAITASFVLGMVAVIHPIVIQDQSPYILARIFLILSALLFLFFSKNDKKISRREAIILILIYVVYLLAEIFIRQKL
ncbi:MAG: sodium:calcium antiporter [Candidatus Staskawiczbacteria bacterium]|nr:sodium:calcium antiporter [Candidatus Staskawiczbacteria bacterium]